MSNNGGPRYTKRKRLSSVSSSIMLYGAPIWGNTANVCTYVAKIRSSYRIAALRVACSYHTISYDAIYNLYNLQYDPYRAARNNSISKLFHTRRKLLSVKTQ